MGNPGAGEATTQNHTGEPGLTLGHVRPLGPWLSQSPKGSHEKQGQHQKPTGRKHASVAKGSHYFCELSAMNAKGLGTNVWKQPLDIFPFSKVVTVSQRPAPG